APSAGRLVSAQPRSARRSGKPERVRSEAISWWSWVCPSLAFMRTAESAESAEKYDDEEDTKPTRQEHEAYEDGGSLRRRPALQAGPASNRCGNASRPSIPLCLRFHTGSTQSRRFAAWRSEPCVLGVLGVLFFFSGLLLRRTARATRR